MIEVPERFEELVTKLIQQLEMFEQAYGHIPKCQLVVSEEYSRLIEALKRQQF